MDDRLVVGMRYGDVVDVLGEPDYNLGFGNINAGWRIDEDCWFVPTFDGNVLAVMEYTDDSSGFPRLPSVRKWVDCPDSKTPQ